MIASRLVSGILLGVTVTFLLGARSNAQPQQWRISDGGNGHYYQAFVVPSGILWTDANALAVASGGHLATITSPGENQFTFSLVDSPEYWNGNSGPYLGGFQFNKDSEPGGSWRWVTDEPFDYTNWLAGEPNNEANTEDYLDFATPVHNPFRDSTWNDITNNTFTVSYVVEYNSLAAPEPASLLLLGIAALPLTIMTRRRA